MIRQILAACSTARILVLSLNDECLYAERLIRAGAKGYLMKQETADELMVAIRKVLSGGVYLSDRMREFLLDKALSPVLDHGYSDFSSLTDREVQVFTLLGDGKGNREIARNMNVSVKF